MEKNNLKSKKEDNRTYQGLSLAYLFGSMFLLLKTISLFKNLFINKFFVVNNDFTQKDFILFHFSVFLIIIVLHGIFTIFNVFSLEGSVDFGIVKRVYHWRIWVLGVFILLLIIVSVINFWVYFIFQIKIHSFVSTAVVIILYGGNLIFTSHPVLKKTETT